MVKRNKKLGTLFKKTLKRIAAEEERLIGDVHDDLERLVNRSDQYIAHLGKGYVAEDYHEWETIVKEVIKRGGVRSQEECKNLLVWGNHPRAIELSGEIFRDPTPVQLYEVVNKVVSRDILLDGTVTSVHKTDLKSISDSPLSSVTYRKTVWGGGRKNVKIQLVNYRRDYGRRVQGELLHSDDHLLLWKTEFVPPLLKNEPVSFTITESARGVHPLTYEEWQAWRETGHTKVDFAHWRYKVTAHTDYLHMRLTFPANYPVAWPSTGWFCVYRGSTLYQEEITRLHYNKCCSIRLDEKTNQQTLELIAKPARAGLVYELRWIPPCEAYITTSATNNFTVFS